MRIRLKTTFFFNNHLWQPGDVIDLPEGVRGPHGARQRTLDRISYDPTDGLDANRLLGEVDDVPLYDVVEYERPDNQEPQPMTMMDPKAPKDVPTLATASIVERRGDDVLDRHVDKVIAHPVEVAAVDAADAGAVVVKQELAAEPEAAPKGEHVFEGKPDARQAEGAILVSRFRPRYRALSEEEKALHDALKTKAAELETLYGFVKRGRYSALAMTALEESVMWIVKELTA